MDVSPFEVALGIIENNVVVQTFNIVNTVYIQIHR